MYLKYYSYDETLQYICFLKIYNNSKATIIVWELGTVQKVYFHFIT